MCSLMTESGKATVLLEIDSSRTPSITFSVHAYLRAASDSVGLLFSGVSLDALTQAEQVRVAQTIRLLNVP
jgi:hypothetical protein